MLNTRLCLTFSIVACLSTPVVAGDLALDYRLDGFTPWGTEGISIYRDGSVQSFRGSETHPVATLSPEQTKALLSRLDTYAPGEMFDLTPHIDQCPSDVPQEVYRVFVGGEAIVFALNRPDCHRLVLNGYESQTYEIKQIIEGLYRLSNLNWSR